MCQGKHIQPKKYRLCACIFVSVCVCVFLVLFVFLCMCVSVCVFWGRLYPKRNTKDIDLCMIQQVYTYMNSPRVSGEGSAQASDAISNQ